MGEQHATSTGSGLFLDDGLDARDSQSTNISKVLMGSATSGKGDTRSGSDVMTVGGSRSARARAWHHNEIRRSAKHDKSHF